MTDAPTPAVDAAPATATASNEQNSRTLGAVAYILTFITGLIIYFVAKDDKYARWHAVQAIGLGIVALVVSIVINMIPFMGLLGSLWSVAVLVAVILLAVKAYQGEKVRIPVVADFADKHA